MASNSEQRLLVRVGQVLFGLPALASEGIIPVPTHVTTIPGARADETGVFPHGDAAVALVDLRVKLGITAQRGSVVLARAAGALRGFVVDEVLGFASPDAKPSPLPPGLAPRAFHGALLHDGRIALLSDFEALYALTDPGPALRRLANPAPAAAQRPHHVPLHEALGRVAAQARGDAPGAEPAPVARPPTAPEPAAASVPPSAAKPEAPRPSPASPPATAAPPQTATAPAQPAAPAEPPAEKSAAPTTAAPAAKTPRPAATVPAEPKTPRAGNDNPPAAASTHATPAKPAPAAKQAPTPPPAKTTASHPTGSPSHRPTQESASAATQQTAPDTRPPPPARETVEPAAAKSAPVPRPAPEARPRTTTEALAVKPGASASTGAVPPPAKHVPSSAAPPMPAARRSFLPLVATAAVIALVVVALPFLWQPSRKIEAPAITAQPARPPVARAPDIPEPAVSEPAPSRPIDPPADGVADSPDAESVPNAEPSVAETVAAAPAQSPPPAQEPAPARLPSVWIESTPEGVDVVVEHPAPPEEAGTDAAPVEREAYEQISVHTVVRGDTLWDIAERYLNDPWAYPQLAADSRITDPDVIDVGDKVRIVVRGRR